MEISIRQVNGVTVVDVSGRINVGEDSAVFRTTIRELLEQGYTQILLNLGDVTYIDSAGVGELISAVTAVRKREGELKLLNLTKRIDDLLQITKLCTVFEIMDNEDLA